MYSSTCSGHPHAHHQDLNNCSTSLWFYFRSVVVALMLVVVKPAPLRPTALSSNKNEKLLHIVGWFSWIVWWCTYLQTLNLLLNRLYVNWPVSKNKYGTIHEHTNNFAYLVAGGTSRGWYFCLLLTSLRMLLARQSCYFLRHLKTANICWNIITNCWILALWNDEKVMWFCMSFCGRSTSHHALLLSLHSTSLRTPSN